MAKFNILRRTKDILLHVGSNSEFRIILISILEKLLKLLNFI